MKEAERSADLFNAFRTLRESTLFLKSLYRSGKVSWGIKKVISNMISRNEVNINSIKLLAPGEFSKVLDEQILDEEVVLQIANITATLPLIEKEQRDSIENLIEAFIKENKANENQNKVQPG